MSEAKRRSTGFLTVDLDKPGKQFGYLRIPHSPHEDAWGATQIPIAVIANGSGPTVILEGGNHGDEYEGQIAITELIQELDPARLQGRLILLPSINAPAAEAGRRVSPLDGLNMNRTFPGDPIGSMTQQISAFVNDVLLPIGDAFLDLHSGGSSLWISPSAIIEPTGDPALDARNVAAVEAFGAPMTVVLDNMGDLRTAMATASRAGLVAVGTEMGGGGGVSPETMAICRRGIRNVLVHLGVFPEADGERQPAAPRYSLPGTRAYVFAECDGVFEPFQVNGDTVHAGELAGRIWAPWAPNQSPMSLRYEADGILYARRPIGRVRPGNCCAVIAQPIS